MSLTRSMSKPLKSASAGVPISNGGYGASVPIRSVPSVIVEKFPELAVVSEPELEVLSSLPHPAAIMAVIAIARAAIRIGRREFIFFSVLSLELVGRVIRVEFYAFRLTSSAPVGG